MKKKILIPALLTIISIAFLNFSVMGQEKHTDSKKGLKTVSSSSAEKHFRPVVHPVKPIFTLACTLSDCMYDNQIIADINGKKYYYTEEKEYKLCMSYIKEERDFNNDGYKDALISVSAICGGSALPNGYIFCTYNPKQDKIVITESFGFTNGFLNIEPWKDRWSISYTEEYDIESTEYEVILEGTHVKYLKKIENKSLKAVLDVFYYTPEYGTSKKDPYIELFDIDNDGIEDKIISFYEPNNFHIPMDWRIKLSKYSGTDEIIFGGLRVGILASTTKGVHDIVVDRDEVYVWNGKKYISKK